MQPGYLLDTNVVGMWYARHPRVVARITSLPDRTPLWVSAITLGEISFGNELHLSGRDLAARDEFERWMRNAFREPSVLRVTHHTHYEYGPIRAALFEKYPPQSARENHPEKCFDRVTASELLIDENDLWIASQAIEKALILVTNDKMERIKEASRLARCSAPLECEDWTI